jgi:two-component system cell cycle sensor histidine kinase/response regulator CckA
MDDERTCGVRATGAGSAGVESAADLHEAIARLTAQVEDLRRTEDLYRRAIAQADAVPYVLDYATWSYTFMGEGVEEVTGWRADEWSPGMWNTIIVDSETQGEQTGLLADDAGERTRQGEFTRWRCDLLIRKKDGTLRWISDGSIEILDDDGKSVGSIGLLQDIDDRKRAEEERARHELEVKLLRSQRLESLGILAGGIAHDFNNLLVGILGNLSLALEDPDLRPGTRERLEQAELASGRAAELTKQMLAFSGKGRFVLESVDLSATVREVTALLDSARARKATLVYDLADDLPRIEADEAQLTQVLMNLLINAAEAIDNAEGTITVTTSVRDVPLEELAHYELSDPLAPGRYVSLDISDSGAGMDEDTLRHIFEPFFSTKFTGRGLGLAAVLGIVRGHHGAIRVTSEPGEGTTFHILFPPLSVSTVAPPPIEPGALELPIRGRALVVDDEQAARDVAAAMLGSLGFEVTKASSGREAIALLVGVAEPFDVVLLDLTMPEVGGEDVLAELKARTIETPVVLSSGYDAAELSERLAARRIAAFLQKPYRLDQLREAIAAAVPS